MHELVKTQYEVVMPAKTSQWWFKQKKKND